MSSKEVKVILLAAGEGKRLRPFTLDRPKCLVEIGGQSLLDRQLSVLRSKGLNDVVVIGGYKAEMLSDKGIDLRINRKYAETNMVFTLFSAESELKGEVLICYGDIVYSDEILQKILDSTADIATTIDMNWESYWGERFENPLDDAETLKIDQEFHVIEIGRKPKTLREIDGQYMGIIKLSEKGVQIFKSVYHQGVIDNEIMGQPVESAYMTDLLQVIIDSGHSISAVPVYGDWVEVDTVSDLKASITMERLSNISNSVIQN